DPGGPLLRRFGHPRLPGPREGRRDDRSRPEDGRAARRPGGPMGPPALSPRHARELRGRVPHLTGPWRTLEGHRAIRQAPGAEDREIAGGTNGDPGDSTPGRPWP